MAELILKSYKIEDVLNRYEYAVLARYFEKQKNYRTELETLGAIFANNLQSVGNYGTYFTICGLLQIPEMLENGKYLYNANKILEFAFEWAEEEDVAGSETYVKPADSIKLLRYYIKEMQDK